MSHRLSLTKYRPGQILPDICKLDIEGLENRTHLLPKPNAMALGSSLSKPFRTCRLFPSNLSTFSLKRSGSKTSGLGKNFGSRIISLKLKSVHLCSMSASTLTIYWVTLLHVQGCACSHMYLLLRKNEECLGIMVIEDHGSSRRKITDGNRSVDSIKAKTFSDIQLLTYFSHRYLPKNLFHDAVNNGEILAII